MPEPEGKREKAASPLAVVKTVLSAFFGVRRRADHEAVKLNPVHVIVTAVVAVAVFVVTLILLVRFIVSSAG